MNLKQWWLKRQAVKANRAEADRINREALKEQRYEKLKKAKAEVEVELAKAGFKIINQGGVNPEDLEDDDKTPCSYMHMFTPDGHLAVARYNYNAVIYDISYKPMK